MEQVFYKAWIYGIFDDVTDECYYVGCTQHPDGRRRDHFRGTFEGNYRFRDVPNNCIFRILEIIEDRRLGFYHESKWIAAFKDMGWAKYNKRKGGYFRRFLSPPYKRLPKPGPYSISSVNLEHASQ